MKKSIALVLSIGIVFAAFGCSRKETEKQTSSATTELLESQTATEISEEPTEETSETTPAEVKESLVKHDLQYLPLHIETERDAFFGKPIKRTLEDEFDSDTKYERTTYPEVYLRREVFAFEGTEYAELQEKVNAIVEPGLEELKEEYKSMVDAFKAGKDPTPYSESSLYMGFNSISLYRADTQVLSFAVSSDYIDNSRNHSGAYSFDSRTAEPILLDDVVKDKEALADLVKENLNLSDSFEMFYRTAEEIADEILNGTMGFVLLYDGICFTGEYGPRVSALAHPEIFNMEYFGHTPENYSLLASSKQVDPERMESFVEQYLYVDGGLIWDFNEDGQLDCLSATHDTKNSEITLFGNTNHFNEDYSYLTFVQVGDEKYLFARTLFTIGSFEIQSDGQLEIIADDSGFRPQEPMIDPDRFVNEERVDMLNAGAFYMYKQAAIEGGNVIRQGDYTDSGDGHRLKVDLTGKKYDIVSGTEGEEIQVEKDSYLVFENYCEEDGGNKLICRVYEMNVEEYEYVIFTLDRSTFTLQRHDYADLFHH